MQEAQLALAVADEAFLKALLTDCFPADRASPRNWRDYRRGWRAPGSPGRRQHRRHPQV